MSYGIADLSIVPMRSEKSERSEMVSQILFGEVFEILEVDEKWVYVRMLHDRYEGWIDRKMYLEVTEFTGCLFFEHIDKHNIYHSLHQNIRPIRTYVGNLLLATEVFNIVVKDGDYGNKLVVSGSVFPFFDATTKKMQIGGDTYTLVSKMKDVGIDSLRDLIIGYALMYYNTPYLWGGRSPYGIDCSGLSQIVYRMAGIDLPRDASQQVTLGQNYSFLEEAMPGDLAFFGDETGAITHVGIIWEQNRIIHASGRVRVDKIDHQGIFNEDLKRYTHNLKVIKRILND